MRTTTRTTRARLATTTAVLAGAGLVAVGALPASAASASEPDSFTSAFTVQMTPDMVVDSEGQATGGDPDGSGTMDLRVNSDEGVICFDITTRGVEPPYESPAVTATHVHEAPAGQPGPPRIAFPNPEGDGDVRTSSGCLSIPMDTGVTGDDGQDTGAGFSLTELEADPAAFFGDTHTSTYVPGAVRGQLVRVPVGGADTGAGGVADGSTTAVVAAGAGLAAVGAAGVVLLRRRPDARAEG
ncbi:CHRD domain-containing protein [Pseudokineococcus marinus]|uniref:CHRD domain-containing protein n=1 Tax=Pseudokineococcus marinus TaxID=351215 RepID=A0A849BTK6_9ACTN|nr:CHRD domain-containing protein [Pseudokineococcus marinus]NNH24142.1 CHRD domain-containing protein [Pseudokineococcus marinus]